MKTWGGKGSKDREGRGGEMEKRLERADRCCSAGRRRLWWGVNNLSVWKRRSRVNLGSRGTYGNVKCQPKYTRHTGVTEGHHKNHNAQCKCILCIGKHLQTHTHTEGLGQVLPVITSTPSCYITRCSAQLTDSCGSHLYTLGILLRKNCGLSHTGATLWPLLLTWYIDIAKEGITNTRVGLSSQRK